MIQLSYRSLKTEVRESIIGGSVGKPGRCLASVTAPKTMMEPARPRAADIGPRAGRLHCQRVEDNAFRLDILRDDAAFVPLSKNRSARE